MSNYYPAMVYRMVSLEPALRPPTAIGLGAVAELPYDSWCTTTHIPTATCKPVKGVVIPLTAATLNVYKALQRQVNALLVHGRMAAVAVDGRPGTNTQTALLKATRHARDLGLAPPTVISQYVIANQTIPLDVIAKYAVEIVDGLGQSVARLAAPAVPDPPQSRPSQPAPATGGGVAGVVNPPADVIVASASPSFLDNLGVPKPVAYAALAVGALALYKATRKSKGGGRRRR